MEKANIAGVSPLYIASYNDHLEVARYLLEQGADRDKPTIYGMTPLHIAAENGHLEIAKLLMVFGADLNARNHQDELPIDMAHIEEIQQAIRDEPRRRMDHGHKRATEQDRHPNAAVSASVHQEEEVEKGEGPSSKKPRLDEGEAEEDEDSEPSDGEDD